MQAPLNQTPSPTDEQRHEMLREALERAGRPEDYEYILRYLAPEPDITSYAAPGELKGVKIGILGGGLAGMAAAFELRKLGADITILEASQDRIGGRVYTFYFDSEGIYFGEFGAMRIPVSHETTWHYINLFGLATLPMTSPRRNNFLYVHNTRLRTTDSIERYLYPKYQLTPEERSTPWSELSEYAMNYTYRQLTPEIRAQLIQILPQYSPEYLPLINMSLRQNFQQLGLSQGAINLISGVDSPSGASLNISYAEVAHEDYTFDYINTYRIDGGNVTLPLAFYNSFRYPNPVQYRNLSPAQLGRVAFKLGHTVTGIYQYSHHNQVIIGYRANGIDSADIFDYVICALPFSVVRTLDIKPYFSNMKMQAILELNYEDAQKTLFLCNHRFWERDTPYGNIIGGISFTDLPIQSIIYPSDHNLCPQEQLCSPEEPGVLTASYNLGQNATRLGSMGETLRYELIRKNVEEVHGLPKGVLDSMVEYYQTVQWNREPLFRGAFATDLPQQKQLFAYIMQEPEYNNHVFFAGEHVSTKHAWMQGALASGKAAANRLAIHFHNYKS